MRSKWFVACGTSILLAMVASTSPALAEGSCSSSAGCLDCYITSSGGAECAFVSTSGACDCDVFQMFGRPACGTNGTCTYTGGGGGGGGTGGGGGGGCSAYPGQWCPPECMTCGTVYWY